MFELFKDITSEMFPSTWLSTGYRRKNTGWNKADYYNNKQNLPCLFKGPCLSHNSLFFILYFTLLSQTSLLFGSILKFTWVIYILQSRCWSSNQLQGFVIIKPGVHDGSGQNSRPSWEIFLRDSLRIRKDWLFHPVQPFSCLIRHALLFSSFFIDLPRWTSCSISQCCRRLYSCLLLHLAPLSSLYPSLCHPLIDAPLPIYTSAPALTPINYLASRS